MTEFIFQEQMHYLILGAFALFTILVFYNLTNDIPRMLRYVVKDGKISMDLPSFQEEIESYLSCPCVTGRLNVLLFAQRHGIKINLRKRAASAVVESILTLLFLPNAGEYKVDIEWGVHLYHPFGYNRIDWVKVCWVNKWWPWKTSKEIWSLVSEPHIKP